jgi:predicted ATPase
MNLENLNGYSLYNIGKVNIILGKNGTGKSTALKEIDKSLSIQKNGHTKYITPERGGTLRYEPGIESNISSSPEWYLEQLRQNQWTQFKEQSVYQYRKLEILSLREIEKDKLLRANFNYTFDSVIEKINSLLDKVKIIRGESDFKIHLKDTNEEIKPNKISSGESELISLAIECFAFQKECKEEGNNLLFFDEPDVHLHPDLQVKFAHFVRDLVKDTNFKIIIATHSTALLGGFCDYIDARFDIITFGQKKFDFKSINELYKKILPVFGAHPLSNLFNESPIMLVEGEDDVRIWQQAIRTSESRLKLYPCATETISQMNNYEIEVVKIINSIYDSAKAYSLRDRDDSIEQINDLSPIIRFRLSCRNAENLILSDEVLNNLNIEWNTLKIRLENWIKNFETHSKYEKVREFYDSGFDRKNFQLKEIRNIIIGLTNSEKPWEVAVGQVIGKVKTGSISKDFSENKICNYLGNKIVDNILQ